MADAAQLLHLVGVANQTKGPLPEEGAAELLAGLRALNKLCDGTKGGQVEGARKAEGLAVLSAAVLCPHYSTETRAHAAGVLALVVHQDKRATLSEQVAECLVAMIASDHRLAQKKAAKAINHALIGNVQNRRVFAAKGATESLARFVCSTPYLPTNWMRLRWACGALGCGFANDTESINRVATCDGFLASVVDLLKVRSPKYGFAKCGLSLYLQDLSRSGEGALVMVSHQLHHAILSFIDSALQSLISSRFQLGALLNLFKHDVGLHALIGHQSLATAWRYLLYHARTNPDKKERSAMVKLYVEAVTLQRSKVKLLVRTAVTAGAGCDHQRALDALLAFVFMSPTKEEKVELLIDRGGLDILLKALHNDVSTLNVFVALNCLVFGDAQIYEQSGVPTPSFPAFPTTVALALPTATAPGVAATTTPPPPVVLPPPAVAPPVPPPVKRVAAPSSHSFAPWRADQALYDVAFRFSDEGKATAHKLVLAAKSTVFKAMFTSGMREGHRHTEERGGLPEIAIPNIGSGTFHLLLDFCYGVHLLEPAPAAENPNAAAELQLRSTASWLTRVGVDMNQAAELLAAAGQYEILDLEDGCAYFLGAKLDAHNVVDMLSLGLMHRATVLVFRCFQFVLADPSPVLFKRPVARRPGGTTGRGAAARTDVGKAKDPEGGKGSEGGGEGEGEGEEVAQDDAPDKHEEMDIHGAEPPANTAAVTSTTTASEHEPIAMHQHTEWAWKRRARWQALLGDPYCRLLLRDFILRGMMGVPQCEYVAPIT